ncbi:hypothetical protein MA16_Dca023722 [Dendrobium catenatum]|uniref:Uncharacterized protein n=1 Tax=Dendrobium catenatum TaxID=906689 RepID=A0A2I0X0Q3_9ASPA|nr:hypothetical protein MA16_Dca023722 [Dendrobium catenatum]
MMYNRRLRDRNLKKKGLMDDEDPLLCDDVASDDEWFVDDEVEVMPSELQDEDLNVDFFDGLKASTSTTTQEQIKKDEVKGFDGAISDSLVRRRASLHTNRWQSSEVKRDVQGFRAVAFISCGWVSNQRSRI